MLDGLVANSQSDAAFWIVLVSVGLFAVVFSLKLVLSERRDGPRHRSRQ